MKNRHMKHIGTVALSLLICVCIYGIIAYFATGDQAINRITSGTVTTRIEETFEPPDELIPGSVFVKEVAVKNTGTADCFVRIRVTFSDSDMEQYCRLDWNTDDYVYQEQDGYWYYRKPLEAGDATSKLFRTVTISENIPEQEIKSFDIAVYQKAVQKGNAVDYEEAWNRFLKNRTH